MKWQLDVVPSPSLVVLPAGAASLDEADAAIELWEFYKGRKLDPSQRLDVQLMLAVRDDGMWAASVTGHEKPRQNGKGDAIEVVEFWGLSQRGERIGHTIHEAVLLATETQQRLLSLIDSHPDLRRKKGKVWQGVGQQMIEFGDGIIWYRTRTGGGLRGIDEVDRIVVDEAQHAEIEHLSAATPAQAVSANPQLNALGTGALVGKSDWWWKLRKQTKRDTPSSFGYLGYSAQSFEVDDRGNVSLGEVDPYDRQKWWDTNAALHAGRITEEFLERQLAILGAEAFAQEHLCVWAPPPLTESPGVIDLSQWDLCAKAESAAATNRTWALAVAPDQSWASLAVAGRRADGLLHVDVVERRKGTAWIVERVVEAWQEFRLPLRVAARDRNTLVSSLQERGVKVVELPVADVAQGVGLVRSLVQSQELAHLGRSWLRSAVKVAQLSSSGVWVAPGGEDVSALDAVTLAASGVPAPASTRLAVFVT
jgi:hypothetical protein